MFTGFSDRFLAFSTSDLDEAIDRVGRVYCPHELRIQGRKVFLDSRMHLARTGSLDLVQLAHGAPVDVDPGRFGDFFLITSAIRGSGTARQDGGTARWTPGRTLALSADLPTRMTFDAAVTQLSVRVDRPRMEELCGRLIGHPLDRPLRFRQMALSAELEAFWQASIGYIADQLESDRSPLRDRSPARIFEEYLLSAFLRAHPHNYSDEIDRPSLGLAPRLVRQAEAFIERHSADAVTMADIASHVGVSVRSVYSGFREFRDTTPMAHLRSVRLASARARLLEPRNDGESVTSIALACGFRHLGRFSTDYRGVFGEYPRETLRRRRASTGAATRRDH